MYLTRAVGSGNGEGGMGKGMKEVVHMHVSKISDKSLRKHCLITDGAIM